VGADGVIFALPGDLESDYTMRIYNSDGSEPEMCGNGIRCLARYLRKLETGVDQPPQVAHTYRIHTLAGIIAPTLQPNGLVTVDMGSPYLLAGEIPTTLVTSQDPVIDATLTVANQIWQVTCVSMGNPHCVTFVAEVDSLPLATLGPEFERHEAFPQRINAEFIQVVRPDYLKDAGMGTGRGYHPGLWHGSLCCPSGRGTDWALRSRRYSGTSGGCLQIRWSDEDNRIYMTGAAERVFDGQWLAP
jgi:diaminopimelate epimerase